jgi:hypothetical protein
MADSAHEQLQAAALARIRALGLPGVKSEAVRRLKVSNDAQGAARLTENLTLPGIVLTTSRQLEEYPTTNLVNGRDDTVLPLMILILSKGLWDATTDAWATLVRETIRRSFRGWRPPLTGGAVAFAWYFAPGPVVTAAVDGQDVQCSVLLAKCRVRENRIAV